MCPFCLVVGDASDCDAEIQNKPCKKYMKDPVCFMEYHGPDIKHTQPFCTSRRDYLSIKFGCENHGSCVVTMCDTSGWMAEIPSGK